MRASSIASLSGWTAFVAGNPVCKAKARTKSEARARLKAIAGIGPKGRLPAGMELRREPAAADAG